MWSGQLSLRKLLFHQLNVSLRQVAKGQTPEESADGEGLGTFEEMKEAWGKMGSQIRLTFRSNRWFQVVPAPAISSCLRVKVQGLASGFSV